MDQNGIKRCLNCENTHTVEASFCPFCGQQTQEKISFRSLFANTIGDFFSFDSRFIRSIPLLLFRPGYLTKVFVGGKRKKYLHPGRMYLFCSFLFLSVSTLVVKDYLKDFDLGLSPKITFDDKVEDSLVDGRPSWQNTVDSVLRALDTAERQLIYNPIDTLSDTSSLSPDTASEEEKVTAFADEEKIGSALSNWWKKKEEKFKQDQGRNLVDVSMAFVPYALFLMIPIFALLLKLFFWSKGNYAEHLIFVLHYMSFLFFIIFIILAIGHFTDISWRPLYITMLTLYIFFYLFIAALHFYQGFWPWTIFRAFIVLCMYIGLLLPMTLIIVFGGLMFY